LSTPNFGNTNIKMMKNIALLIFLSIGSIALAQPTSGDITMEKIDSSQTADPSPIQTQQTFEALIIEAFKTGNATKISTFFGENIELSIQEKSNIYSNSQAQQILQRFFTEHVPSAFSVIHKGESKTSMYFIGELTTASGLFRVSINSKTEGAKKIITSLTISDN